MWPPPFIKMTPVIYLIKYKDFPSQQIQDSVTPRVWALLSHDSTSQELIQGKEIGG